MSLERTRSPSSFFRDEEGRQPADNNWFKPGDGVFVRFDIVGNKPGPKNKVDVSYVTTVIAPSAVEQSEFFYPQRYAPANTRSAARPVNRSSRSR